MDLTEDEWTDYLTRIAEPLEAWAEEKGLVDDETWKEWADRREAEYKAAQDALRLMADRLGNMWD